MMKALIILSFLLIPLKSICQTINLNLTSPQATEVYKGLIQGENLKSSLSELQKSNIEFEKIIDSNNKTIQDLKNKIFELENKIKDKDLFILNQEKICDTKLVIQKEKSNKPNAIGLIGGYGISLNSPNTQGFIGIGYCRNIFRF